MSENKDIKILKKIAQKFKAFLFSKDALSFLSFLLLSAAFWFAHAANKEQEKTITIPLHYTDIPKDIAITNSPPKEIKLKVKDLGIKLFSYSKKDINPIHINFPTLGKEKDQITLSSNQIISLLQNHLQPTTSLVSITPDSIHIKYKKLKEKTLPVKLNLELELAQQYILSEEIKVNPEEIKVYGDAKTLKNLKFVETTPIQKKEIKNSTTLLCDLEKINDVNFSTNQIEVKLSVEMFTEKKITLPVEFKNNPKEFLFKAFPPEVNVTYNIAESIYNSPEDHVEIIVDYNEIKNNEKEKYKLKAVYKSDKIFNVRIVPDEIEFILKERKK